jgi:YD repeat-containing protein
VVSYDSLGRPASQTTTIDTTYTANFTYDAAGRRSTVSYPTGFGVKSVYNAQGYLAELRNNASNALYWRADATTAAGQLSAFTLGNGLAGSQSYSPLTGRLETQTTGTVQSLHYAYDAVGNLAERNDAVAGLTETFTYDALNRLTQASLSGASNATLGFAYDALGNLTYKSDVGNTTYPASGAGSVRPHAVAAITGSLAGVSNPSFSYDANGNLTSGAGKSFTWTAFDLPSRISQGATNLDFTYGPEHQRPRQISPSLDFRWWQMPRHGSATSSVVWRGHGLTDSGVLSDRQTGT